MTKDDFFKPENAKLEHQDTRSSPSGKYKLVITPHSTGKGSWNYTQGLVYSTNDGKLIAEVRRNYSSFPFLFIEDHPKGDFLVCGENYQGQTVIELTTGKRKDLLSDGTEQGWGFCWVQYKYDVLNQMIIVDGCHWACPYEFRFYDFSDPMDGWPEIKTDPESTIDDDDKWPEVNGDIIKIFQTKDVDDDEDQDDVEKRTLAATLAFKREGNVLKLIEEWVSDEEKEIRLAREEANRKYEEWLKNFRATDPLYLERNELLKDPIWSPSEYDSIGITHDRWCPDFKGDERRMCKRILERKDGKYTVDLEWAVETGPIKVIIYKDGNNFETKFFEHSITGMREAFNHAKAVICIV